jgi:ferredoxin
MCLNCLDECRHDAVTYRTRPSDAGEILLPDLSRRGFIVSAVSGLMAAPVMRLGGITGPNWNPGLIRPPGALPEAAFLSRCIKCGQCMRICPTNVIHPAGWEAGLEGLWTPKLNFRVGTSGCQHTCIACGNLCPTAAIRPIRLDERTGRDSFSGRGPIRIGTAFVDRGRCLPWAMDRPVSCARRTPVSQGHFRAGLQPVRARPDSGADRSRRPRADTLDPSRFATGIIMRSCRRPRPGSPPTGRGTA